MVVAERKRVEVVVTGISEVDDRLGGGIPLGSLCLVEGDSDAGKSVLCQHLAYGTLGSGQGGVAYYTTENSIKSLIVHMDSIGLCTLDYFLCDHLRIFPLAFGQGDCKHIFGLLTDHFSELPSEFKLIIVDSITLLLSHSKPVSIIDFFAECKSLCEKGICIILVAHSYAFEEEVLSRTRSMCDARFKLRLEGVGDRLIKLMEVLKVRGADRPTGDVVSFDVEPKTGMRIIPLSKARV
jgi:flagellar protein FlaH